MLFHGVAALALHVGPNSVVHDALSARSAQAPSSAWAFAAINSGWAQCLDGNTMASDRYTMACHDEAKERLFTLLHEIIAARQVGLATAKGRRVERAQAKWLKRAMDKCASDPWYRFNGGGTKYPGTAAFVDYGFCIIPATQKRITALLSEAR